MTRFTMLLVLLLLVLLAYAVQAAPLSAEEFTRLVAQTQDKDAKIRAAAVRKLGETYDEKAAEPVRALLHDPDPAVLDAAAEALTRTDLQARDALKALFKDKEPNVRAAAARAVWVFRERTLAEPLLALLPDDNARVRAAAAYSLGYTCEVKVLEPLRVLLEDDSTEVRAAAAGALGQLGQLRNWVADLPDGWEQYLDAPQSMDAATRDKVKMLLQQVGWEKTKDALAKLLDDKEPLVRSNAILALQSLRDPRAKALLGEGLKLAEKKQKTELLYQLINTRDAKIVDACIAMLPDEADPEILHPLVRLLGAAQDRRAIDSLTAALPKANPKVRGDFIWALGWIQDLRAAATVRPYLQDTDPSIRAEAAFALGFLHDQQAVEPLLKMVNDPEESVRRNVVMALGYFNDKRSVQPLLTMLPDAKNANIRQNIIQTLGYTGDAGIVDAILPYKDDVNLRATVFRALASCANPRATEVILAAYKSDDPTLRKEALNVMGSLGGKALLPVVKELLQDKDVEMRVKAMQMLYGRVMPEAFDLLVGALKDGDARVRKAAVERLGEQLDPRVPEVLKPLVKDPDEGVRTVVMEAIRRRGGDNGDLFLELMKSPSAENRLAAIRGLQWSRNAQVADTLIAALKDADPRIREAAAQMLPMSDNNRKAADALAPLLQDGDMRVRIAAASSLENINDPRGLDALIAILQDAKTDVEMRVRAAGTLIAFHDPRVVEACLPLMKDANAHLRAAAACSLSQQQGPKVLEALLDAVKDADPLVRSAAAQGLGNRNDPRATAALQVLLKEGNESVRQAAMRALQSSNTPGDIAPVLAELEADLQDEDILPLAAIGDDDGGFINVGLAMPGMSHVGSMFVSDAQQNKLAGAIQSLRNKTGALLEPTLPLLHDTKPLQRELGVALLVHARDPRALPDLATALKDDQALVRRLAARALRLQGDVRSLPPLLEVLKDHDAAVRAEAALALGQVADTRATTPLLALLTDKQRDVQFAAAWALGRIADSATTEPLLAYYQTCDDPETRAEVLFALGRIGDPKGIDLLLTVLQDGTPWQRRLAIEALGTLKEKRAVDPLLAVLQQPIPQPDNGTPTTDTGEINGIRSFGYAGPMTYPTTQRTLRAAAAKALGAIGDPRAIEPLLALYKNADTETGYALEPALQRFPDTRVAEAFVARLALDRLQDYQNARGILAHSTVTEAAIPAMITALKDPNPLLRKHLLEVLSTMTQPVQYMVDGKVIAWPACKDPRFIAPLQAMLPDADKVMRQQVLNTLGQLGAPHAGELFLAALKDVDRISHTQAAYMLKTLKDPATVPGVAALLKEQDAGLRSVAADILAEIPGDAVTEALAPALADADDGVRAHVALALCRHGDARGLDIVSKMQATERDTIKALMAVKDPRAVTALIDGMKNVTGNQVRYLLPAVWQINDPKATEALLALAQQELSPAAGGALPPRRYSHTMDVLLAELRQRIEGAQPESQGLLPGPLTDPRMLDLCIALLQSTPRPFSRFEEYVSPFSLRRNAIWLLGHSASPKAVQPLIDALEAGPLEDRQEAAIALGKLGDKRAIAPLTAALHHVGADARPAVEAALKAISGQK